MRELAIAYGSSRMSKKWSNKIISYEALCERLSTTVRTSETVEEYPKLAKSERDSIKDNGGFVGGTLKKGKRKADTVQSRSMLALDIDNATKDFLDSYEMLNGYESCLYTTHSHTSDNPRYRIIVPLQRDVSAEEYVAISRHYANEWGIDMFDKCSYLAHQLMYWPTTSSNGEFIFKKFDGEWLNPDTYLGKFPNWRDCSQLPTSSSESSTAQKSAKKQQDPISKDGIVGMFCRTYSIHDVLDKFLNEVYQSTNMPDRYSYIQGESTAGLVIYDDVFAYSNHATDPAYQKELNAFDLVRVHLFPDDLDKKSFNAMADFASKDESVKVTILKEKQADVESEFAPVGDWTKELKYMPRTGLLENSVWNEMLILNNDPDFANFAYNEMAHQVQFTGDVPWTRPRENKFWMDADTAQLKARLDIKYGVFSSRNHEVCFVKVTSDRSFHPIREKLDDLEPWDEIPRLDTLFIDYLGAEDTPYNRAIPRKWLTGGVARVYVPGIKIDSIPVLDGPQGIGKSTLGDKLAGNDYFCDSLTLTAMQDKTGAELLQGHWIIEIGELAGMRKADIEAVKAFISRRDDKYRASYGRVVESHPRQCIIFATVNGENGYLRDSTGNRRFWPIKCNEGSIKKPWDLTEYEINQIWAEAKVCFEEGEKLYLDDKKVVEEAEVRQNDAIELDPRESKIVEYLDMLLPEEWENWDTFQRRDYFNNEELTVHPEGIHSRSDVCPLEIWCECFGKPWEMMKKQDSYDINTILKKLGWASQGNRKRIKPYGQQRMWTRIEK